MYQRKDGTWADTVKVPGRDRPKFFYGKSPAEVKRKIAAWNSAQVCSRTVRASLDAWLVTKENAVAYNTYEGYKAPIKHINDAMGDMLVTDVTPAVVQAFVRSMAAKGYKRTSVQRPLNILRMMYDFLITEGGYGITVNPCAAVKLPSGLHQERRGLVDPADIEIIKNGADVPFGLFALLLLYTGLRKGEALALTYSDFDFANGCISISKSVSWQHNRPVIGPPKTDAGFRDVVLLAPLRAALPRKWKGYLFSPDGGLSPLTEIEFRHRWLGYCKAAGLCDVREESHTANGHTYTKHIYKPRLVPHQLRHEFATTCLDAELDPADAKVLLGHANEATTRAVYTHIRDQRRITTAEKLRAFVEDS